MNVLLAPQWDGKAPTIQMRGSVFAVGRSAPSFSSCPGEELATLSLRHAQFFEEAGQLFLVDLGSENGSAINGRPMEDRPVMLRDGDTVSFGALNFKIDIADQAKAQGKAEDKGDDGDATEILQSAARSGEIGEESPAVLTREGAGVSLGVSPSPDTDGRPQLDENTVYKQGQSVISEGITQIYSLDEELAVSGPASDAPLKKVSASRLGWLGLIALPVLLALIYVLFRPAPSSVGDAVPRTVVETYETALERVRASIEENEVDKLPAQLLQMVRLEGGSDLQALLDEATQYRSMLHLLETKQLSALIRQRSSPHFSAVVFETAARKHIDPNLGSPGTQARLLQAEETWRGGELVESISELMQLSGESESDYLSARLAHYTRVVEEYEILSSSVEQFDYPQAALGFYLNLDPLEDLFFWRRLAGDFENTGQREFLIASGKLENAADLWRSYQTKGGITAAMRQQPGVGEAFRQRARELTEASLQLAALSGTSADGSSEQRPLFPALVRAELLWQRKLLLNLQSAIADPEFAQKLELLEVPSAVERPQQHGLLTGSQ